jgi:hypothetical protein
MFTYPAIFVAQEDRDCSWWDRRAHFIWIFPGIKGRERSREPSMWNARWSSCRRCFGVCRAGQDPHTFPDNRLPRRFGRCRNDRTQKTTSNRTKSNVGSRRVGGEWPVDGWHGQKPGCATISTCPVWTLLNNDGAIIQCNLRTVSNWMPLFFLLVACPIINAYIFCSLVFEVPEIKQKSNVFPCAATHRQFRIRLAWNRVPEGGREITPQWVEELGTPKITTNASH